MTIEIRRLNTVRSRHGRGPLGLATALVLLLSSGPVVADWLVMRDGSRVETEGAWRVDGERILFDMDGGALGSVQTEDVDLDASRSLTQAAREAAIRRAQPQAPAPKKKAVFVVTDADVSHRSPAEALAESAADPQADASENQPPGRVEVASWNTSDLPAGNGLRVVGSVRNGSSNVAADLNIEILAYDSTDELLLSAPAILGASAIGPGQSTTLAGELVGVFDFSRVEFDVDYVPIESSAESAPATSTQRPDDSNSR